MEEPTLEMKGLVKHMKGYKKKLKDRHGTQKDKLNSPPSSPQKCPSPTSEPNGLTKGQDTAGISTGSTKSKSVGKGKSNSQTDVEIEGKC